MKKLFLIIITLLSLPYAAKAAAPEAETQPTSAALTFSTIDQMLLVHRPQVQMPMPRYLTLIALDQLLHDTNNDRTEPFYNFINTRIGRVLEDLDRPVTKGLRIYKMYNHGFIIKSKSATIAIDLIQGGGKPYFLQDTIIYSIVKKCDAMFISHRDPDHANLEMAKAFAANGKRVIAPKDLWVDVDPLIQPLAVHVETDIEFEDLNLTLHVLPGHQGYMGQGGLYNNINVVEFHGDGIVAHTGDQWNDEDIAWLSEVYKKYDIDVLIPNCWINNFLVANTLTYMAETIQGFRPKLIITGHENELTHTIDHREAYWMTVGKMTKMELGIPYVLMTWGESYEYKK